MFCVSSTKLAVSAAGMGQRVKTTGEPRSASPPFFRSQLLYVFRSFDQQEVKAYKLFLLVMFCNVCSLYYRDKWRHSLVEVESAQRVRTAHLDKAFLGTGRRGSDCAGKDCYITALSTKWEEVKLFLKLRSLRVLMQYNCQLWFVSWMCRIAPGIP